MPQATLQKAFSLHQTGNIAESIPIYQQVLSMDKDNFDALQLLGAALLQIKSYAESEKHLLAALHLRPSDLNLSLNLTTLYQKIGKPQQGLDILDKLSDTHQSYPHYILKKAHILHDLEQYQAAREIIKTLSPDQSGNLAEYYNLLGMIELGLGEILIAKTNFESALKLNGDNPQYLANLALCYDKNGEPEIALKMTEQALLKDPENMRLKNNRVLIYQSLGQHKKAEALLRKMHEEAPNNPTQAYYLGIQMLSAQDPRRNLEAYQLCEARWQAPFMQLEYAHKIYRQEQASYWLGDVPIKDKRLMVLCEFGFGDFLQMLRFLPLIADQGAIITLVLGPHYDALASLLKEFKGIKSIVKNRKQAEDQDYFIGMMSLPLAFMNMNLKLLNKPHPIKVHQSVSELRFSNVRTNTWMNTLKSRSSEGKNMFIGVVARGNIHHKEDSLRSIPFAMLMESLLANMPPNALFIILQKDQLKQEVDLFPDNPHILNLAPDIHNFADSAALMRNLDLLITIDSAPAHLAGTLGIPTWLLLAKRADWRWGNIEESDLEKDKDLPEFAYETPWYPSVHLFRQRKAELGWKPVLESLGIALKNLQIST